MDAIRDAKKAGLSDAMVANLLLSIFAHVGADAWLSDAACIREVEIWARAIAKAGGMRIGRQPAPEPVPDENGHVHDWQQSEQHSDIYVARYTCECGARGYRERHTNLRGKRSQRVDLPPKPIKEYARDGKQYHARFPEEQPEVTRKPRSAGRNRTGGYLPPSSGGKR